MEAVKKILEEQGFICEFVEMNKLNEKKMGLSVKVNPDAKTGYVFYKEHFAEEIREKPESIAELISSYIKSNPDLPEPLASLGKIACDENVDDDVFLLYCQIAICRTDWNEDRLKGCYCHQIGDTDLTEYVCIRMSVNGLEGMTPVKRDMEKMKTISEDRLWEVARMNAKQNLMILPTEAPGVYFAGSPENSCGAGFGYYGLETIRKLIGTNELVIIPLSVQMLGCIDRAITEDTDVMAERLKEDNARMDDPHDVLSDHVYIWDGETLRNA